MTLFHLLIVAAIQGLTEFLPVSSSGHLVLLPALTGAADQGLAIDVAAHVGSLAAVVLYFWNDVKVAAAGVLRLLRGKVDTQGAFLALCLCLATVPVLIAGLLLKLTGLDAVMRSVAVIGWAMLLFGIVLYWADMTGASDRNATKWTLRDAGLMGLAQMLALIPGTSRAGITITAARRLGYAREDAAKLSMLMSIPAIIGSGTLLGVDLIGQADWRTLRDGLIAAVLSCIAALAALAVMMRLLRFVSFTPYVIYRIMLGVVLLVYAYA